MSNKIPKDVYNTVIHHLKKSKLNGDEKQCYKKGYNPEEILQELS